jgi:hypothetical protein
MLTDCRPTLPVHVPNSSIEWNEVFIQLESEIALAKKAGAPGTKLGALPSAHDGEDN